ncbi:hypothetical protein [Pedobacter alpinus]|uniref:hypothetical protein n=1 Tax=Pedobacter alpinus TaxID=1590643 RepID=UPI0036083071
MATLAEADGSLSVAAQNKVVLQLVNMRYGQEEGNDIALIAKLLVTINFLEHSVSINHLTKVADYFRFISPQGNIKYLTADSAEVKIVNLAKTQAEWAALFQSLGTTYKPSLAYQLTTVLPKFAPLSVNLNGEPFVLVKDAIKSNVDFLFQQFIFAPNTYSTWLNMEYLVDIYLYGLWEAGDLKGETAADAYRVQIGLGKTMTAEDILNKTSRLALTVCLDEPNDFTQLTFSRQLAD